MTGRLPHLQGLDYNMCMIDFRKTIFESRGIITLVSILIFGAMGLTISLALIMSATDSDLTSVTAIESAKARYLANACADEALEQIRQSTPFTGSNTINFQDGTCQYTVASQGGQNRTIEASGTVNTVVRKVAIAIDQINPSINISSWQEVADF